MIHLILPVEEVNLILKHLGNAPYVEVAQLIQKIHMVSAPQVAEMAAKEAASQIPPPAPPAIAASAMNGSLGSAKEGDGAG